MKTVIFLGAGASKAEGAPLQDEIFKDFFSKNYNPNSEIFQIRAALKTFFEEMFYLNVDGCGVKEKLFPTFEEVLGILDLAEMRHETLRSFDLNRIREIREYMVLMIAKVSDKLGTVAVYHKKLVSSLLKSSLLEKTVFVSTNYDILIDNALARLKNNNGIILDYGIDFTNFYGNDKSGILSEHSLKLYKIHGSLNWLNCTTCNRLTLTPYEKGVIRLIRNEYEKKCSVCGSRLEPIIVPPTYYKNMSNHSLITVWNRCEVELRDTSHLIFCGYSFPEADTHIKYLLKRIQHNNGKLRKVTVINHHSTKSQHEIDREKNRFKRFFGEIVDYKENTFQDFSNDPVAFWV